LEQTTPGRGAALEKLRSALREAVEGEAAAQKARSEAAVRAAALRERLDAKEQAVEEYVRRLEELGTRRVSVVNRRTELEGQRAENEEALKKAADTLDEVKDARSAAWDRYQREREHLEELRGACRGLEGTLRDLAATRDEAARLASDLEVQAKAVQVDVESLRAQMEERYLVSLPGLLDRIDAHKKVVLETEPQVREDLRVGGTVVRGVPDLEVRPSMLQDFEGITAQVEELAEERRRLAAYGEVNLAAMEEYRDVSRRHADLAEQRTDLEESVARIRTAIAKMNRTCRQRFRDTFDRVSEKLGKVYPQLAGGGTARLSLTDEEDLLEAGVKITVQPPGKRLQNLSLLSGGEKAIAAIAMIIALFQVRPSPFCVLDEVDAPLDDANGRRFNRLLREMADVAQFILITHNRKTMEYADTLYGITMPTPGVSRLVSVRLEA
jgi:chromosome segregation protein